MRLSTCYLRRLALATILLIPFGLNAQAQTANDLDCDGCVSSSDIQNGGVKAGDIGVGAVTGSKIKDGTVSGADIKNGAVTAAKLKKNAVTKAKIKNGAVSRSKLGDDVAAIGLTGQMVTPGNAFVIETDGVGRINHASGYINGVGNQENCAVAPIYLPDGVKITRIDANLLDNDPNAQIFFQVVRVNYLDGSLITSASITTPLNASPDVETFSDTTIAGAKVNLSRHAFQARVCFADDAESTQRLYAVSVSYE